MVDLDYLNAQSPKPPAPPGSHQYRVRSPILIQTELDEAHREIAEAEIKRDHTEIERLRLLIHKLANEIQPHILDPRNQAHGPPHRHKTAYHQKKA